jgi:uncharacterized spore protein YtfJ
MALGDLVSGMFDSSTIKRVHGDPIERDGTTVIPAARIGGMFGGGEGPNPQMGAGTPTGWGGGGAWSATPAGMFVIRGSDVEWVPAVDANRTILVGCLTGIFSLLIIRSVARTLAKRR